MARKPNPDLKSEGGTYLSKKEQSKKYDETQDKLILRFPKGTRDMLNEYVREKAEKEPNNPKYSIIYPSGKNRPSVNALIKALLEEEIGKQID